MREALIAWLLHLMVAAVPPGSARRPPSAVETPEDGLIRYRSIATTIAEVSLDPREPAVFDGPLGRVRTAALLTVLAYHESSYRRDVDYGLGRNGRGRYRCLLQVAVDGQTSEGWSPSDITDDRTRCVRAALHILQRSRRYCTSDGEFAWLRLYASGHCDRGGAAVQKRLDTMQRWLGENPVDAYATLPVDDGLRQPASRRRSPPRQAHPSP